MFGEKEHKILESAMVNFGVTSQIDMAIEECSELINALCKMKRGRGTDDDVITEIADVQIMTEQISFLFDKEKIAAERERKIERLAQRIQSYKDAR